MSPLARVIPLLLVMLLAFAMAMGAFTSPQVRHRTTPLEGALLTGFTLPLAGQPGQRFLPLLWKGRVAVINLFNSTNAGSQAEHKLLMQLSQSVAIYGIAWKDTDANAVAYLTREGNPYQAVGVDTFRQVSLVFGVRDAPETYVIDKAGRVRWKHEGALTQEVIDKELLPLVRGLGAS